MADEFFKRAKSVALPTLANTNDIGKDWRYTDECYTVTRTCPWSPPGCHPVGCGLKLYVNENGRLERVEGDENHPVTQGRLCPRCIALKDYVYNPARILHPMKRDPKDRGKADKWIQISWDEAFDLIKSEYDRIVASYGRESIVIFSGTGREGGTMNPYGSMVFGTPNKCYTQSGYACYTPRLAAAVYVTGATYSEWDYAGALPGRWDDERYELTEVLMLWGKQPLDSNPDGFFGHAVIDAMRRGTRLINIDPRVNWLSTRSDIHIQLRAGTDTALGMAMLNIIIQEELYDKDFVEYWCYGFDELAQRVSQMTPEKAAEICWVPVEKIYAAARMYAAAKPAAILWGLAVDQKTNGMQNGQVIIALQAITGNLDRPGGQLVPGAGSGHNELGYGYDEGVGDLMQKMIGLQQYPAYCNMILDAQADLMLKALETGEPYALKMGMYQGNNLMACTSMEPKRWHDAIVKSLEFCIGIDCFMNPSIESSCDIFLPLKSVAERDGTVFTHYAPCTVTAGFMHKAVEVGEGFSDMELVYELGTRLRPELWEKQGFANSKEFIEHFRLGKREHGAYFDEVSQTVVCQVPIEYYKYEKGLLRSDGSPGFATPTGRIELWSSAFNQFGEDPLPFYSEPEFGPVNTPELMQDYPFVLTTGARTSAFFHSEHRQIAYLRELHPDPIVEINPIVAKRLGIGEGQWVKIWNQFGECVEKAHISPIVDENTIHAEHAWWFPEEDGNEPNLYGVFRSNINNLLPNFHMGKLGFGAPNKCLICNIEPVLENYDTDMSLIWEKFGKLV
ncbi:MAG: molybdopterin-dependent oxidoreductase [Coriobacteriales bacterium]|jgi:anaerobic selenocysteine-containing dehydrogenase|nr:molybdopterin-dependent oxidoreductase [Coriobacteriales bacterium]